MQPWQFLPVHPALQQVVNNIIVMNVADFSGIKVSDQFHYPWSAQTSLFFTISPQVVTVKDKTDTTFSPYPSNFIIGPNLVERIVKCPNRHYVLGVTFSPGGLQRLCGLPLHEITNSVVDASFILGNGINELSDQLAEAGGTGKVLELIEKFLLKKLKQEKALTPFDRAIAALVRSDGNASIDTIAKLACLSGRQFQRVSAERLGMSPKLFARLTRFSKAYMIKEGFPHLSWLSIAHQCGYYDQMHLIRDFKTFSGHTPTIVEHQLQNSITAVSALQRCLITTD